MKKIISVLLTLCIMLPFCTFSASCYDKLPAPDWVTITPNQDYSKTVTIKTPSYMLEYIDYYEYSTDGFLTKQMLSKTGGEFVFDKTTEFSLRYIRYGVESETFTVTVTINRITIITSDSTNISVLIPFGSPVPTDITLSAYEVVSGAANTIVQEKLGKEVNFRIFNTAVMHNNRPYNADIPLAYLFPCEGFDARFCKLYSLDADTELELISSQPEMNMLLCETQKTGLFVIAEDKRFRPGDLNGDGEIKAEDARAALRFSAMLDSPTEQQIIAGDINKSSVIDATDARKILRAAAKLENL